MNPNLDEVTPSEESKELGPYRVANLYDIDYLLDEHRVVFLQANRAPSVADMKAVARRFNALVAAVAALKGVSIMLNTELAKYESEPWAQRVRAALALVDGPQTKETK